MDIHALPGQFFGLEVRRLREDREWSQAELAKRINFSDGLIGYVETNQRTPTGRFAAACDAAFDSGTYLSRLCRLARHFATPHAPLDELLKSATSLQLSDPLLVPALAQTEDYARAVLAANCLSDETVDELLARRVRLADLLGATQDLNVWMIIDETCLYRPMGCCATLRLQLKELTALIDARRVIIQILKTTSPMIPLLRAPQVIMTFPEGTSLAHQPDISADGQHTRYVPADDHIRAFNLLRAAALPPGISQGAIAQAIR